MHQFMLHSRGALMLRVPAAGKVITTRAGISDQGDHSTWHLLICLQQISEFEEVGFTFSTRHR